MSLNANNEQPRARSSMGLTGGNLNVKNMPMDEDGRDWSNSLYDCSGTCLCACCCPCVIYAKNKRRYDHMSTKGTPDPESGGGCCSCDCIMYTLVGWCGVSWILQCMQRGNVRRRYKIKGGQCSDCLTSFCCMPCELAQEYQELELEEKSYTSSAPFALTPRS